MSTFLFCCTMQVLTLSKSENKNFNNKIHYTILQNEYYKIMN